LDLTLTFDNGPEPETTPFVLDVLARRSIRTTFFVVGNKLSTPEGRELARRAHEEGHWIGNHTWSHSMPLGLLKDPSAIGAEIRDTQQAIGTLAHPHRFFRPFGQGGNLDERLLNSLGAASRVRDWAVANPINAVSNVASAHTRRPCNPSRKSACSRDDRCVHMRPTR
jgi:peptidoglycan/xylan/chitin deacetylase (PgdA/CDA1 family)